MITAEAHQRSINLAEMEARVFGMFKVGDDYETIVRALANVISRLAWEWGEVEREEHDALVATATREE